MTNSHRTLLIKNLGVFSNRFYKNDCIHFKVLNCVAGYTVFPTVHALQILTVEGGELHRQTHAHTPVLGPEGFLTQSPYPPKSSVNGHPVSEHLLGARGVLCRSAASLH